MGSKKVTLSVNFTAFPAGAGGGIKGSGILDVEIHGSTPFLGLSTWHSEDRQGLRFPFVIYSRTALSSPDDTNDPSFYEATRYSVHTTKRLDPLEAADLVLRRHLLSDSFAATISTFLPDALKQDDPFYRGSYHDQVVEPICTAILGMCRDASLWASVTDAKSVQQAIGTWKLGKELPVRTIDQLLEHGVQIQDVLMLRDTSESRALVSQALL